MVIYYLYNLHPYYFSPDVFVIFIFWDWILMRLENKSIRLIQITSPFTFSVLCKLMVMPGHIPDVFESVSSIKIGNSSKIQLSALFSHLLLAFTLILSTFLQVLVCESQIHLRVYFCPQR